MHASVKELLELSDGVPVSARIAQHAAECALCAAELARLQSVRQQLRQLPEFRPPPQAWRRIERALQRAPESAPRTAGARVAAVLIGVALLSALLWSIPQGRKTPPADGSDATAREALPQLVAQSQQIEAVLRGWQRPAVEQAATSAAIDELQTRIQLLDAQLSNAQETGLDVTKTRQLWTARVQLLNSLLSVRYAEQATQRDWLPVAGQGDI